MRELSLHILDLVQNAIEAGATKVSLEIIEERQNKNTLLIRVEDNGRGMEEATLKRVTDPFVTSRNTRRIGLGLSLIHMSTQMCEGYLNIVSDLGRGTMVEALYKHSHIDRPPMGNIAETIRSIIIGNPELNFSYSHRVDRKKFSLTTQEMIEILGDIPLTEPMVLVWLQEYLGDNLMNLYDIKNLHGGASSENN